MTKYKDDTLKSVKKYMRRYFKYAFNMQLAEFEEEDQYKAVILKLIYSVEKGLSVQDYRYGAGKKAVQQIIEILKDYSEKYNIEKIEYRTALCVCDLWVKKNKNMVDIEEIEAKLNDLPGVANELAGIENRIYSEAGKRFEEIVRERKSVRHFSKVPVELDRVYKAIDLARYTPSACNRQGWKVRIIQNELIKNEVLINQNGNRGFGNEIDKLLLITYDLRYINIEREWHQAFIDGGMYAMSLLYALQYMNIASITLSASLYMEQEDNVRNLLHLNEAEVLIVYIGIGNYAEKYQVPLSNKKPTEIEVI